MDKNTGFHPYGQFVEAAFPESDRDIVPLTWKDGTTTYNYRGNEYLTEEEAIAARDGPAWGKKAVEFAGKTLMSSPTINTIVNKAGPIVGKALGNKTVQDAMTMPGEDTVVPLIGDSFVQYGFPRIVGEGLGYGIYPGPENPTKFDPGNVEKIFNATRKGNSLIDAGTGAVIRNNDGIVDNSVFKITGSNSGALPEGISAREWFKRVDEDIVKEEVLSQGGTEFQAKQIYRDHQKKLTGKKGIKATIKELNDMWNLWEPNTQIKLVSDTETGGKKMMMMTKTGNVKTWEFDHDHIQAVINTNRPEGGLRGADMAANIEIMFRAMNREKSNVFELDERLLRELGVPYDFKEYIFNKLNPDLVPESIPQRWKEVFSKSILNDYYELKPNTPTSKHNALMGRLIRKYKKVFTNKQLLADIEYLEDIPFWKKYPPNEIPKWAQTLELPNDPLTDKFWNQLPPKAKKRWENMVRRKHQELKFEMEGYKPSKGRYRIKPDD